MNVPTSLAERRQWVVWKKIQRRDTTAKLPFSPLSRNLASTTDPRTWSTLQEARTAMATRDYDGLGYVFARGGGQFGIDLDTCVNGLFDAAAWATETLRTFRTYAERSPSTTGIKLFALGNFDQKGFVVPVGEAVDGGKRPQMEFYGWGRFFAFTGDRWPDTPEQLNDCQRQLDFVVGRLRDAAPPVTPRPTQPRTFASALSLIERGRRYLAKVPPAKEGQGGSRVTFRAAYVLLREIGLSQADTFTLLDEWNDHCLPPWTPKELWQKIASAMKAK